MKFICPLVVVENIQKSKEFYENVLEQKVKFDFGENVTFVGDFAIHQKDHFQKLIQDHPIQTKSNQFELYFEHDDIKSITQKIKKLGLEFVHEIVEQPWKQRVIRFYDYDYNLIEIGESMKYVAYRLSKENYSVEEICKITYLPKEVVEKNIQK